MEQFGRGNTALERYEAFVTGEGKGPDGWDNKTISVMGDESFVEYWRGVSKEPKGPVQEEVTPDEELILMLGERIGCKPEVLLRPQGREERKFRHTAFRILIE
jgi:hypothetical protein